MNPIESNAAINPRMMYMEGMNEGTAGGRAVVVLRGKPECHSGLNFWNAWNLITSN